MRRMRILELLEKQMQNYCSLHSAPLHLYFTSLHSAPLHLYLYFTSLHFPPLHSTPLHFTPLYFTPLHFIIYNFIHSFKQPPYLALQQTKRYAEAEQSSAESVVHTLQQHPLLQISPTSHSEKSIDLLSLKLCTVEKTNNELHWLEPAMLFMKVSIANCQLSIIALL